MINKFAWIELNRELLQSSCNDKHSSKDGKDGKEGKDDVSAIPDTCGWI